MSLPNSANGSPSDGSCSPTDSGCDDSSKKSKGPAPLGRCEDGSSRKLPPRMPPAGTRYQRCPAKARKMAFWMARTMSTTTIQKEPWKSPHQDK